MDDPSGQASSPSVTTDHPRIHLYAEHLQNIRTLSIQASLATFSNTETKATLSADGSQLSLSHEGETATIQLPITVPGGHNDATLTIPSAPSKELTFRLSLSEKPGSNLLGERPLAGSETIVPWMSSHLSASAEISCANCQTVLIPRGAVTQWKDLPSEGWAEMMDFWHCHKPDVPHDHHHHHDAHGGNGSAGRGIGANSQLAVERGVGLVGPLEILFAKEDTRNIKVSSTHLTSSHENTLLCTTCNTTLGNVDTNTQAHRLGKPSLSISDTPASAPISHAMELWLSCHLLTAADAQGVRKFKVYRHGTEDPRGSRTTHTAALQIWLFATDLVISSSSSSASQTPEPLPVLKIFYKRVDIAAEESTGRLDAQALSEGELELPRHEWELLNDLLEGSAELLPARARGFQEWRVLPLAMLTEHAQDSDGQPDD
ncbi:hypothetical protein KC353_g17661 [Hortaea werneckii]|nr:hypothetical protein KC353_g17661 [Hortaea werneckii]